MKKFRRLSVFLVSALLTATAFADDESESEDKPAPSGISTFDELLWESAYTSGWGIERPVTALTPGNEWQQPIADVEFQDSSGIGRITQLRSLSFLTLASSGKTRLFFGVNEKGLLGIHYRAVSTRNETEHREVLRLSYFYQPEFENADSQAEWDVAQTE